MPPRAAFFITVMHKTIEGIEAVYDEKLSAAIEIRKR